MCVCTLALVIGHANCIFSALSYTVVYGVSGCTIFLHIISRTARRLGEKSYCT